MVELHNYASASSQAQKLTNWDTLNSECYHNFEQSWNSLLLVRTLDGSILWTGFTRWSQHIGTGLRVDANLKPSTIPFLHLIFLSGDGVSFLTNKRCHNFLDKITFYSSGKVFSKLSYNVPKLTIKDVVECKAGVIELVLANIRLKVSAPIKNNLLFLQICYFRRHQ